MTRIRIRAAFVSALAELDSELETIQQTMDRVDARRKTAEDAYDLEDIDNDLDQLWYEVERIVNRKTILKLSYKRSIRRWKARENRRLIAKYSA